MKFSDLPKIEKSSTLISVVNCLLFHSCLIFQRCPYYSWYIPGSSFFMIRGWIRDIFRTRSNIYDEVFRRNSQPLLAFNYFRKKTQIFGWVLNVPLTIIFAWLRPSSLVLKSHKYHKLFRTNISTCFNQKIKFSKQNHLLFLMPLNSLNAKVAIIQKPVN